MFFLLKRNDDEKIRQKRTQRIFSGYKNVTNFPVSVKYNRQYSCNFGTPYYNKTHSETQQVSYSL